MRNYIIILGFLSGLTLVNACFGTLTNARCTFFSVNALINIKPQKDHIYIISPWSDTSANAIKQTQYFASLANTKTHIVAIVEGDPALSFTTIQTLPYCNKVSWRMVVNFEVSDQLFNKILSNYDMSYKANDLFTYVVKNDQLLGVFRGYSVTNNKAIDVLLKNN